jgi:hypothetical protein
MFAAQSTVLESTPHPYGYGYGFGDEDSTGAYLGVDITDVTPERLSALKLKDEHGVEVTIVDQDAPAGKAGIKEHDVILTMNGATVDSGAQLRRMIRETPPGRVVSFGISRDGQPVTVKVQLGDRRKNMTASHSKDFKFEMPAMPAMPDVDVPISVVVVHSSLRSGLMVENLTPQLGDFFGVKNGKGVLVRSVEKGSRADKAGFRAGDIVVKVNDQAVQDTSDFSHALRSRASGTAAFVVIRDKKEQTLSMQLPDQKESGGFFEQETFDLPQFDARNAELSAVRNELAQMQPQIQLAVEQARQEVERAQPEIEKAQRLAAEEIQKHQPDIDRAMAASTAVAEKIQREFCAHQKEFQAQIKHSQEQMQKQMDRLNNRMLERQRKQMERLRHEFNGDWLDI